MGIEETDFAWAGEQCGKGFTEQVASQWSITTSQMDLKGEKSNQRLCARAWRPETAGNCRSGQFSTSAFLPSPPIQSKSRYTFPVPFPFPEKKSTACMWWEKLDNLVVVVVVYTFWVKEARVKQRKVGHLLGTSYAEVLVEKVKILYSSAQDGIGRLRTKSA